MRDSSPEVAIVTLCKSLNAGAFLQAYALQEVLKRKGLSVQFLDVYDFRQSLKRFHVLFRRNDRNLTGIVFGLKKYRAFRQAEKHLNFVARSENQSFDAAFFGSDEIWSVTNTSFVSIPEFFGNNVVADIKVSYAPSAGNACLEDTLGNDMIRSGLEVLDFVSVRDANTRQIAEHFLPEKKVTTVLDPTFLHDFAPAEIDVDIGRPYVAVYSYGLSADRIDEVKSFARDRGCITVSPGFNNSWCDIVLPCGPFQFLSVIKNASWVVTDTFHGTIFAIKYRRPLICYTSQKKKVVELLLDLRLEQCGVEDGDVHKISDDQPDYSSTGSILEDKIERSHKYIDRCIDRLV